MLRLHTSANLLLYLEWILLAIATSSALTLVFIQPSGPLPLLALICAVIFGWMGLKLPAPQLFQQLLYTFAMFALIWVPNLLGESIPAFLLLVVIIVIRSCQIFDLPGRLLVVGSNLCLFILNLFFLTPLSELLVRAFPGIAIAMLSNAQLPYDNKLIIKINLVIYFGLMVLFVFLLVNALLSERKSREKLSLALKQLRQYALLIEDQATLQERNRIAREIHDSVGHTLTAQSIQLDSGLLLLRAAQFEQADSFLKTAKQLCTQALQDVRQSVSMLRADPLKGLCSEVAIGNLIQEFQQTTAIAPSFTFNLAQILPIEVSTAVYRILQEALTNITRHSQASEVTIQVVTCEQILYVLVKDNGIGFDPEVNLPGFGLQGMQERINTLEGQLNLVSQPGAGCLITAQIPLKGVS
ncbi:MAG: sensor histidine kinase [Anaerolineae bacterium]|nr:sensor histidine kinase [Gloeobacterales cyanobacterium ES-bin-313]